MDPGRIEPEFRRHRLPPKPGALRGRLGAMGCATTFSRCFMLAWLAERAHSPSNPAPNHTPAAARPVTRPLTRYHSARLANSKKAPSLLRAEQRPARSPCRASIVGRALETRIKPTASPSIVGGEPEPACGAGAESAASRIAETCASVSLSITVGVSMRQSKTCVFTATGWPLGC
jgi:hypothetical protein